MNIIGFGGSGHDWSTCVLNGPLIVAAVDEERISRLKYGIGSDLMHSQARSSCLRAADLEYADIDHAVGCDLVPLPLAAPFRSQLVRIRHHLAHAYGAFFGSPFDKAAVLIADGAGSTKNRESVFVGTEHEVETISYWHAQDRRIEFLGEVNGRQLSDGINPIYGQVGNTDNSLGYMYWTASEEIGFMYSPSNGRPVSEDGKTMGLAAYGGDEYVAELGDHLEIQEEGQIRLQLANHEFRDHIRTILSRGSDAPDARFTRRAGIARAVQEMLERSLLHCATFLRKRTCERFLAMAGGVALNCVANSKIAREAGFDDVFVLPAAGDNGIALGAAVYGLLELADYRGQIDIYNQLPFLGPRHGDDAYAEAAGHADRNGAFVVKCNDMESFIAGQLAQSQVVAWYEGRSEFGPRALGHRSILADPRSPDMKDHINRIVKRREEFRPFAPIVPVERVHHYFDMPDSSCSPFMLLVGQVRTAWKDRLPAITHVDNTARVQVVDRVRYPAMHRLLFAFEKYAGVPVILNTSLNRAGEPIVESPLDAMKCFLETDIDLLVMERDIFAKK